MKNYELLLSNENLGASTKNLSCGIKRVNVRLKNSITVAKASVKLLYKSNNAEAWKSAAKNFHFIPQIKQKEQNICGAHVFRAPVTVLFDGKTWFALVPDVHSVSDENAKYMFMDMRFAEKDNEPPFIEFGFIRHKVEGHFYYTPTGENISLKKGEGFAFYILEIDGVSKETALHKTQKFILETLGKKLSRFYATFDYRI